MTATQINTGLSLHLRVHLLDQTVVEEVITRDSYRLSALNLVGATVVDLGAHVGVFSTRCAQLGAARIIAVEPEPANRAVLLGNVAAWPQIEVVAKAMGATNGTTCIMGESGGAHTCTEGTPVDQISLRELLDSHRVTHVDLLKLDMEGAEVDTLLAANPDMLCQIDRIVMETHGPKICPWITRPHVGELVEHLLYTHRVETAGHPEHLGMIYADRYR